MERYANAGPLSQAGWAGWDQSHTNAQRSWQEDGSLPGPISQYHQSQAAWTSPSFWVHAFPGNPNDRTWGGFSNKGNIPVDYPLNRVNGTTRFWLAPQNRPPIATADPKRLQSFTAGGIQVLLMDGSVRNVTLSASAETWTRALVPDDGLVMGGDW
jgi:hypothetical protein